MTISKADLEARIAIAKARMPAPWYRDEILLDVIEQLHEELIAARARIAELEQPVRITIMGQDWAISHGDSKRVR